MSSKQEFLNSILKKDELYAGIILGKNDEPDYHLILLPGEAKNVTWTAAKEFASRAGGELPTRREQSLLFANLPEQFKSAWYWSGEQHSGNSNYAWCQGFYSGYQGYDYKGTQLRARAVRRSFI